MIEALNGFLYVLVFYLYGWNSLKNILICSVYCLVISALIVLSIIDFRTNTIPFGINIFIFVMGLAMVLLKYFYFGKSAGMVLEHIIGFCAVSGFLLLIFYVTHGKGIGGGDIKLMAAAGLVLGWKLVILAFFTGCILASIIHPIRMKVSRVSRVLAFGPYLSVGTAIALLYGKQLADWYIQKFFVY
jgi:leader peptidase (prepilin peptidase)/N-methyltransferase